MLFAASANAANTPTFRDCSLFVSGFDEDFVQISGVAVGPEGELTVPAGQKAVDVEASESPDPGDNLGHVTLTVSVSSRGIATRSFSAEGTGKATLSASLRRSKRIGRTYTIEWAATFDNGNHLCPSENTPENTKPNPFSVRVA
jgi:hypothetical protein